MGVAVVGLAPFAFVAGGAMADQTVGFALHDQGLQRLPFPWRYHGGVDPNKLLEFYLPAILVAGRRRVGRLGAVAPARTPRGRR